MVSLGHAIRFGGSPSLFAESARSATGTGSKVDGKPKKKLKVRGEGIR